jgi:Fe-S-cluster-containing dehydrogenase component
MACYNCFVACRDEHCGFATEVSAAQPHMGHFWMRIVEWERGDDNRRVKTATVPTPCAHCENPPCAAAAKDGAVFTRPDGIVLIDPEKAKGERGVADSCPIGAIYWNEELQIPQKCTMCAHLLDRGYTEPRCVESCPNGALVFGDLDDPESEIRRRIASGKVTPQKALAGISTHVVHLNIPTVFFAGSIYLPDAEAAAGARVTLTPVRENAEQALPEGVRQTETNYFGDFEFEDLEKGVLYDISIELPGYRIVRFSRRADIDHFLGELILIAHDVPQSDV